MLSKFLDLMHAEITDPAVQRGIIVVLTMIGVKYGLDQVDSGEIATAIWAAVTIAISRAPGKIKP